MKEGPTPKKVQHWISCQLLSSLCHCCIAMHWLVLTTAGPSIHAAHLRCSIMLHNKHVRICDLWVHPC